MTPAVYCFLSDVQHHEGNENDPDGGAIKASKLKREERTVPDLIFAMEEFEVLLINLSGKGESHAPSGAFRYFRIG